MESLMLVLQSLLNVFTSLLALAMAIVMAIVPWLPVLAWVGFWLFAVNWNKVFPIMWRGGFIGVLLLMFVSVLVWGAVAPPVDGKHVLLTLSVGNYFGKFVYVTMLTCIALLCGSAQLSGAFGSLTEFPEESVDDHGHDGDHGHGHGDGHDHHDGHGHQDSGHMYASAH
jgi:hypothetical protein